jgi:signal peptidase I
VKRVIGVPGDHIHIVNKQVWLNGNPIQEPYKYHKTFYLDSYRDNFPSDPNTNVDERAIEMLRKNVVKGEVVVPPECYFAMGDNRDGSLDSRYWGFVPRANIIGKPLLVYWSFDSPTEDLVSSGIDFRHLWDIVRNFASKTRWKRTFMIIRGYPTGA